jgi:hypothetical protein
VKVAKPNDIAGLQAARTRQYLIIDKGIVPIRDGLDVVVALMIEQASMLGRDRGIRNDGMAAGIAANCEYGAINRDRATGLSTIAEGQCAAFLRGG